MKRRRLRSERARAAIAVAVGLALAAALTALIVVSQPAQAAMISVTTTADELNENGNCSLREAIQAANTDTAVDGCTAGSSEDVITLPEGLYTLSIAGAAEDANQTGDLDITSHITIEGAGANATVIDGNGLDRVFDVRMSSGSLTLSGVTVRGGGNIPAPADGGGLRVAFSGTLTVIDSTVTQNSAANQGGGIYNQGSSLTVIRSTISDNVAGTVGGGIFVGSIDPSFELTNSTVSGNAAEGIGGGGGIHFTVTSGENPLAITNSTITNNTNGGIRDVNTSPTLKNSIVAGQASGVDCDGSMTSLGHNLDSDESCDLDQAGDILGAVPVLGPLQKNGGQTETHALLDGSPAIDSADNAACPETDQRGVSRPQGPVCDIGAYEREGGAPVTPTPPATPTPADSKGLVAIEAGSSSTCGLTVGGHMKCWGANDGRLGNGSVERSSTPVDVCADAACTEPLSDVVDISVGIFHACAVRSNGGVKCWGRADDGKLGDGTTLDSLTPVDVCASGATPPCAPANGNVLTGVIAIEAAGNHTCALMLDTTVKCWGRSTFGQLGEGTAEAGTFSSTPVDVCADATCAAQLTAASIAAGTHHTCAVSETGGVKCWGQNSTGKLGDGTSTDRSTPVDVCAKGAVSPCTPGNGNTLGGITAVSGGQNHTCAVTAAETIMCWGHNDFHQLGDGSGDFQSVVPVDVCADAACASPLSGVEVATGSIHTCARTGGGETLCWGSSFNGELGDGAIEDRSTPVHVCAPGAVAPCTPAGANILVGVEAIAVGAAAQHTCALTSTSALCWGIGGVGQLGDGTEDSSSTPVHVIGLDTKATPTPTPPVAATQTPTTTPTVTPAPELLPPTGLTAQNVSTLAIGAILLEWNDNATGELQYQVQRDDGGGFQTITFLPPNATSYLDDGLPLNATFVYQVRAVVSPAQVSDWSNPAAATTTPFIPPIVLPVISVNSTDDVNVRDNVMTLREAILVATGQLAIADLTMGECGQLFNTSFNGVCEEIVSFGAWNIIFDVSVFPVAAPSTIELGSDLPALTPGGHDISGAGAGVIIDGGVRTFDCFSINSDGNTIAGLEIANCDAAVHITNGADSLIGGTTASDRNVIFDNDVGVLIEGSSSTGNDVFGNYIGTDPAGMAAERNTTGVSLILGAQLNAIGGAGDGEGNLISGNGVGVHIAGGISNSIAGNLLGTNATGLGALANSIGVRIAGGTNNTIGGAAEGAGNVISGNSGDGVEIDGSSLAAGFNHVQGNLIGADATGLAGLGNGDHGVEVRSSNSNTIGGTAAGARNVISGNGDDGIALSQSSMNAIHGNRIGVDAAGTVALANNRNGISIFGGGNNVVGGTALGAGNVISGNGSSGMDVRSSDNVIQGNLIGTDATGLAALPNDSSGLSLLSGSDNLVGGTDFVAANIISGNERDGITMSGGSNRIEGNRIGTDVLGTSPLPNQENGIFIGESQFSVDNQVQHNIIAFNVEHGVLLNTNAGTGNTIRFNSIHSNGGLGIDLDDDGVTLNDRIDEDEGPNNLQNFPVLNAAVTPDAASPLAVSGTFRSTPETMFVIDLYANDSCDPSGFGEGERHIESFLLITGENGRAGINVVVAAPVALGEFLTATATTFVGGDTSEFSECIEVVAPPVIPADDLRVRCLHSPIWPQPGQTVTITAEALDADLNPVLFADNVEIWVNNQNAPVASGPSVSGARSHNFLPQSEGFVDYGCQVQDGAGTRFSGWRKFLVGDAAPVVNLYDAVPVLYNGSLSNAIDIVFIADEHSYSGSDDPEFQQEIMVAIRDGYYSEKKAFLGNQRLFNFWIARGMGEGFRDDDEKCILRGPDTWDTKTTFADVGAILHNTSFRDCAQGGKRLFSAQTTRGGYPGVALHETGHAPFGLSDEYCCDTGYFQATTLPNVYTSEADCEDDAPSVGRTGEDCRSWVSDLNDETYWTSDPDSNDLMVDNREPQALDLRRIFWFFLQCVQGNC